MEKVRDGNKERGGKEAYRRRASPAEPHSRPRIAISSDHVVRCIHQPEHHSTVTSEQERDNGYDEHDRMRESNDTNESKDARKQTFAGI